MSATVMIERVMEGYGTPLEHLGEAPCPTPRCKGVGQRVRVFDAILTLGCDPCQVRGEAAAVERERREAADALTARAGGTDRMRPFTFKSYPDDAAGKAAKAVAIRWRNMIVRDGVKGAPNLYLHGPIGTGKTGLVWPVVKSLCDDLVQAKFVDFPSLLQEMKNAYSHRIPFDEFSDYHRVAVLVLDDLGAEKPTEWTLSQLLNLVNARYERRLPTAFVSNYSPSALAGRLTVDDKIVADRIVSRMTENVIRHEIKAKDRRA